MSNARDLILELMGDLGLTQAEIARHLGRSPDMVRLVRLGKRPGNNLVEALRELRTTGHVSYEHLPPRRRRKDGKLAAVRAPVGDWKPEPVPEGEKPKPRPTRAPQDPKDPEQRKQRRNRFAFDRQVLQGGARRFTVHTPKKPDAKGRAEAERAMMAELLSGTRSQSARNTFDPRTGKIRGGKLARLWVTYENGKRVELGSKVGYYVSDIYRESKKRDGFFNWLQDEMDNANKGRPTEYVEKYAGQRIVEVEAHSFYSGREQQGSAPRKRSIND